jgi:SAM-dependent methyltransferase
MRITYRHNNIKNYWEQRWSDIPVDTPMENKNVYPLKYANLTIQSTEGKILEAGCGAGRVLRYYHSRGHDIIGMDFIEIAIEKLKNNDPTLNVETGDITNLGYRDEFFQYVLSFGLYHNLEHKLVRAVQETYRVLKPGGKVCASFRADNFQTKLTDAITEHRSSKQSAKESDKEFHKMNLTRDEFTDLFKKEGFLVEEVHPVVNMPVLYKFSFFRKKEHRKFNENLARKEGYQLSPMGKVIQNLLMKNFPEQFCNIFVLIASKPKGQ